jgi:hypothetical protein
MAGLATNQLQIYRQMACKTVQPGDHDSPLVLTNNNTNFLYQAYLGRAVASSSNMIGVFVDDNAIKTGSTGPLIGDTARTWYEGVSFARVNSFQITSASYAPGTHAAVLTWRSTPDSLSLTTPTYTVQKKNALSDPTWSTLAAGLSCGGSTTSFLDIGPGDKTAFYRISSP